MQAKNQSTTNTQESTNLADLINHQHKLVINDLRFEEVTLSLEKMPFVRKRVLVIIEDRTTGEVHVASYWNRNDAIRRIYFGHIGIHLIERYGKEHRDKIRVWIADQLTYEFGRYQLETYMLPRLVNRNLAKARAAVQRRTYANMKLTDREVWRATYPYAIPMVLGDHEDNHLRRA